MVLIDAASMPVDARLRINELRGRAERRRIDLARTVPAVRHRGATVEVGA